MSMSKATWFVFGAFILGACKGELSLSGFGKGGSSPKPSSSGSSSSGSAPSGGGGGGGGGPVTAVPEVGKIESGKAPPWCGGYEKSTSDSNKGWVTSYIEREGLNSAKTLEYMAKAACDKTDSDRQKLVAEWQGTYKTEFGATDKDFVEAMTLFIQGNKASALEDEQCAPYKEKDTEIGAEERTLKETEAWMFGCGNDPDEQMLYWLDKPNITEVQRAALVTSCIGQQSSRDEKLGRGEFAFCLVDMKSLDRAKFDKEIAGMKLNLYGKVQLTMSWGQAKAKAQALLKKYAEKGAKDEEWKRLFDAPEQGWKEWMAIYEANKDAYKAIRDVDQKVAKGSKKALAGCGDSIRKIWFDHFKQAKKIKKLEDAVTAGTDVVGYPLLVAMMRCDAANERYLEVAAAQDLFMQRAKESRGPRYAAYDATLTVLNEIRADREKFPLDRMYPDPPRMGQKTWYKAYEQTFNKISYDKGTGQIKDIKKKGDNVNVIFKTVKWKEEEAYDCKDTRKVYRIRDDGTLEYYQKCKYKIVQRSSTLEPVVIPKDFADGLKEGLMVEVMINRAKDGTRFAVPKGVWKDIDKKKFTGTFGVVW
jgi:hypothetical protein